MILKAIYNEKLLFIKTKEKIIGSVNIEKGRHLNRHGIWQISMRRSGSEDKCTLISFENTSSNRPCLITAVFLLFTSLSA